MSKSILSCIYFLFIIQIAICEDCERPLELRQKEEYCWSTEIEIVDRVITTSKNILNMAKKKLGIGEVEDLNEPKKCEYYQCIFQQLRLLNGNGYPVYDDVKKWVENHATYRQTIDFFKQFDICNDKLTNSITKGTLFLADSSEDEQSEDPPSRDRNQTKCEIAAQFMKCLSKQEECSIFLYP